MDKTMVLNVCSHRSSDAMQLPVKEADFPAEDWTPIWLDNSRVLFRGGTRSEALPPGVFHRHYVWDVAQSTIAREARFDQASMICVSGDHLSYLVPDSEGGQQRRVMFANGRQIELPEEGWFNPMSCRVATTRPAWAHAKEGGRTVFPLLEDHGYIDCGIAGNDDIDGCPVFYYRSSMTQPIALAIGSGSVSLRVRLVPFLNAYLLENLGGRIAPNRLWLLHSDGNVEEIDVPRGDTPQESSWSWIDVTKRGMVLGKDTSRSGQTRDSGMYLWANGVLTQLVSGVASAGAAVSPDGSKMAFIIGRQDRAPQGDKHFRLQMIELCRGDECAR